MAARFEAWRPRRGAIVPTHHPLSSTLTPHTAPSLLLHTQLTDDKFRSRFLWGRRPMLAACAARLKDRSDLVYVDLGGGTGVSSAA